MSKTIILAVVNGKGDVSKTTTAVNLAAILSKKQEVLLVDSEHQKSATWWTRRDKEGIYFDLTVENNAKLLAQIYQISNYRLVVGTPPALRSEGLRAVILSADHLILSIPPTLMDLTTLIKSVHTMVVPFKTAHLVLLTKIDSRSVKETLEAKNTLLELKITPTCHTFIRQYKAHERAVLEGVLITEW